MLVSRSLRLLIVLGFGWISALPGQEEEDGSADSDPSSQSTGEYAGVGVIPKLHVTRKSFPNFLTDEVVLSPHLRDGEAPEILPDVFAVGAPASRFAIVWDPVTCRLIGILDLEAPRTDSAEESSGASSDAEEAPDAEEGKSETEETGDEPEIEQPSPFLLVASGPAPLAETAGGAGEASYFGMRLVQGRPEFLYTVGNLVVEERLWLENGGDTLRQRFRLRDFDSQLSLRLPESWRERVESDRGEWDDNRLLVPDDESRELLLTYRLHKEEPESAEGSDESEEE